MTFIILNRALGRILGTHGTYRWKPHGSNERRNRTKRLCVWNKLIIDNLTFHSLSKYFVQATAAFSTRDNIAVAGIREIKVTGKYRKLKFDLIVDSEKACRRLQNSNVFWLPPSSSFRLSLTCFDNWVKLWMFAEVLAMVSQAFPSVHDVTNWGKLVQKTVISSNYGSVSLSFLVKACLLGVCSYCY